MPAKKTKGKGATLVSSDLDLGDDELGITPRTQPQSPFYRGPPTPVPTAAKTTSKPGPSATTTGDKKQCNKPQKEVFATPAPPQQSQETSKKKKKKLTTGPSLQDMAEDQAKLYQYLNKTVETYLLLSLC